MPLKGVGTWEEAAAEDVEAKKKKSGGFQSLGLGKELLDAILKLGYSVPTPIQRKAIPPMMQGLDVVAMARTGSGKTAAYLIPMLHHLKEHSKIVGIRGLILSPTRELSLQILRNVRQLGRFMTLTSATLVGGNSLDSQFEALAGNPDIVVASPGRLLHIMEESGMQLSMVRQIVLDEADRLFEQGLQPQIVAILQKVPEGCQRSLFSATMPSVLAEFAQAGLHNPAVIRLDTEMKLSDKLSTATFVCRNEEKLAALLVILTRIIKVSADNQALVFVESKHHVDMMEMVMGNYGISCAAVHGQMDQEARRLAVHAFSKKKVSVMVVTDVAARGLDLPLLDNVVNFSFPFTPKLFVHRVGRVARAGRTGSAFNILTTDDMPYYIDLMKFLDRPLVCRAPENGDFLFNAKDGCYGRLVQDHVALELDYLNRLQDEDPEIGNAIKVSLRAHDKYTRTKKKATREGAVEARKGEGYRLDEIPIHPMLVEVIDKKLISSDAAKLSLRKFKAAPGEAFLDMVHGEKVFTLKYKPNEKAMKDAESSARVAASVNAMPAEPTVSSLAAAAATSSSSLFGARRGGASSAETPSAAAPKKPLSLAESLLLKAQERKKRERTATEDDRFEEELAMAAARAAGGKGKSSSGRTAAAGGYDGSAVFRDPEFFLPSEQGRETIENAHYSVKDATIDIAPETAEEMRQQRSVFAWNARKNRYQKMHVNDAKALLKGIKNEAGKAIDFKTKLEAYSKWTRTSNMRIQDAGEEEDLGALSRAKAAREARANGRDPDEALEGGEGDEDFVDISDPNQGKKLRIGRKQKRLPADGHVRNFQEMTQYKRDEAKKRAKNARKKKRD